MMDFAWRKWAVFNQLRNSTIQLQLIYFMLPPNTIIDRKEMAKQEFRIFPKRSCEITDLIVHEIV
jgi:hypothetical protein